MKSLAWPLAITVVVVLLLVLPIPVHGRAIKAVLDLGHLAVGALLVVAAWGVLRPRVGWSDTKLAWVCFGIATVVGLAAEKVQGLTGRHASWLDAASNAAGALAFLLACGGLRRRRWLLIAAAAVVALAPGVPRIRVLWDTFQQRREAPLLASFEGELELTRWAFHESEGARVGAHATHGDYSLEVVLGPGRYPGASLVWPLPDWRGHAAFLFDVYIDDGPPIELIVKIEDHRHDKGTYVHEDRFHAYFELGPGLHQLSIPMADIRNGPKGRELEIDDVKTVQWFVDGLDTARTIHLDDIRLR